MSDILEKLDKAGLSPKQQSALTSLCRAVIHPEARVIAIVGSRGSGKTTMMQRVHEAVDADPCFAVTEIIDAALIDREAGILSTCIQALFDTGKPYSKFSETERDLKNAYEETFRQSLSLGDSFRQIAREMSMAPKQYLSTVEKRVLESRKLPEQFEDFLGQLREYRRKSSNPKNDKTPRMVVFLDDLDLAPTELLRPWAKAMVAHFAIDGITWVLSYNQKRMVDALSSPRIHHKKKKPDRETGDALLNKLVSGNDQFVLGGWSTEDRANFLPLHHQDPHATNNTDEKPPTPPSLQGLLERSGNHHLLLLLPGTPRGLEQLYEWLDRTETERNDQQATANSPAPAESLATTTASKQQPEGEQPNSKEQGDTAKYSDNLDPHVAMVKLAEVNHWKSFSGYLKSVPSNRIACKFTWSPDISVSAGDWVELLRSAKTIPRTTPLFEMPLPTLVRKQWTKIAQGEALTEVLCHLALRTETMTPYQLLGRMPFTHSRLNLCQIKCRFHENKLDRFLKDFGEQTGHHLFWGAWHKADDQGMWHFTLSPQLFWEKLLNLREGYPRDLLKALYYHQETLETHLEQVFNDNDTAFKSQFDLTGEGLQRGFLPRSLRALILLVDALERAPWHELEARQNHWSPITLVQCASAFQLSALAYRLWPDEIIFDCLSASAKQTEEEKGKSPEQLETGPEQASEASPPDEASEQVTQPPLVLYFPSQAFSRISQVSEQEINKAYRNLVITLTKLVKDEREIIAKDTLPSGISYENSRRELLSLLAKMLALPAVKDLSLPQSTTIEKETQSLFDAIRKRCQPAALDDPAS
ncbi:ATP-binding protein [Acanthopleuribacter pedis]|uniref:ATP-binding protein n=1 Tax=Acanthopleuribacter pedis TaxID=442870 RepID=A0A8J7Q6T2_9BACT|nr:ATP-binding protein [Acanthopleuribacter pedis]MBO1319261.1 ATP-binding protein [Acanthopleuribacter pedis]